MSLVRIYIVTFLLVFGLCNAEAVRGREIKVNDSEEVERSIADNAATRTNANSAEEIQNNTDEDLPILPPIILLDFDNGTINGNETADEKSKRTVNNGLGYGFDRNSLLSRKYNYYFPAGKTGTTVSIEESISPFLPKTIIEKVQPTNQRPVSASFTNVRQSGPYRNDGQASSFQSHTSYQYYNPATKSQAVFGLRTRLSKTSSSDAYRGLSAAATPSVEKYSNADYRNSAYASTTPRSLTFSPMSTYTVANSGRYTNIAPNMPSYATEAHSQRYLGQSSQHTINVQDYLRPAQSIAESSTSNPLDTTAFLENAGVQSRINSQNYIRTGSNAVESSTSEPSDDSSYMENTGPYSDLPRYTVENGIRYENKIFWKYPDGRVSDMPPITYETYSEYPSLAALQAAKPQEASPIYEPTSTENSILSQGPVQFPMVPESASEPSPFISAESLSSISQQQIYRLGYQNLVSQKQIVSQQAKASNGVSSAYSTPSTSPSPVSNTGFKSNAKNSKNRYESSPKPFSKYMVNSPNPEYTESYTTESIARSPTTPNSFFNPSVNGNSAKKTNAAVKSAENYSNLQYSDLLSYNPSISQYIKNPASILNVQPTFVQAGNTLIPVIILRVDGVPPIQPKATPNVNLKALLQQYLLQYANSIEELARPSNYELGNEQPAKDQQSFATNSLRELARLVQNEDLVGNPTDSYIGRSSYDTSNLSIEKNFSNGKYGERTAARPKVKSVQIIEEPRFTNYRVKN